jgi:glycosyltransferase involved in cell wall biosynthesis
MTEDQKRGRVTRVIARLNVGGPAIQAITLTKELERFGYVTRLVRGVEDPAEGTMDYLAEQLGVAPTLVSSMRRDPSFGDLMALLRLVALMRRDRPKVVHTHAAKGGTLGRLATVLAFPLPSRRPVLIHTYHGHSLTGYFSARKARFYTLVERILATQTDVLLAVSSEVRDDLIGLGVAPASRLRVMPLGFDLSPFTDDTDREARRLALRKLWGLSDGELVVTLIARLVPIKRVDRFLDAAVSVARGRKVRFVVVGDGELGEELKASSQAKTLAERLVWAGFRRDIPDVCFASDVVMLTSDNEGTPVSLIEAQAAAVPVVATDVGGTRSVVLDGESGLLSPPGDSAALVAALGRLLDDPSLRRRMGDAGRSHVTTEFTLDRLVSDHASLYDELLASRHGR